MAIGNIEIKPWIRPVMFRMWENDLQYTERRGIWHRWISDKGTTEKAGEVYPMVKNYGLVETEDGHVFRIRIRDIRFLDSEGLFSEYAWQEDDNALDGNEERKETDPAEA